MKLIRGIIEKFSYAFSGLIYLLKYDRSIQTQLVISLIVIMAARIADVDMYDFLLIIKWITLVVVSEFVNSAIEHLADYVSDKEHHILIKRTKDISSAAVLIMSIGAAINGIIIFSKYLF